MQLSRIRKEQITELYPSFVLISEYILGKKKVSSTNWGVKGLGPSIFYLCMFIFLEIFSDYPLLLLLFREGLGKERRERFFFFWTERLLSRLHTPHSGQSWARGSVSPP